MSKNTKNYKLYTFTSDSDVADLKMLEPTFDTIDKGLVLDVGESSGNGNNYILNLGSITLTSANKGISLKFWADKNSTGAVTINGTYRLIKASGSSVTNLKKGAPYTITYDGGTNFFLASGGGTDDVNFSASDLLTGKSANDSNGEKVNGTMPNKGAVTQSLSANGSLTLPKGYYDSIKITQSLPTKGATTWTPKTTNQTIASGTYLTGTQTIKGDSNLIASNIISGKSIFGVAGKATIQSLGGLIKKTFNVSYTKGNTIHISSNFTPKIILIENYQYSDHRIYIYVDFSEYISGADIEYVTNTSLSEPVLKNVISNVSSTGFDLTLPNSETSISGTTVYNIRGIMIG